MLNTLEDFVKIKYNKNLRKYYPEDIDRTFVIDYSVYLQELGKIKGNKAGARNKLANLKSALNRGKKEAYFVSMKASLIQ